MTIKRIHTPIQALSNLVFVETDPAPTQTDGGIMLPDTAQRRPQRGVVRYVGPGLYVNGELIPVGVVEGDVVLYSKFNNSEVEVGDKVLLMFTGTQGIWAIVGKEISEFDDADQNGALAIAQ